MGKQRKCPDCGASIRVDDRSTEDSPSHYDENEKEWLFGGYAPDSILYCLRRQIAAAKAVKGQK